ncbi:MAG: hypothetical protein QNJ44_15580 [Rhodobacter sp.]|nr:hypothetical protein [Rhodobacter sp.]
MTTDRKRLQDKLAKLATEESTTNDGWRRIGGPSTDLLSAVATEIDETLYPVKISLRNASGEVVDLAVGHRRLRCVTGRLPKALGQFDALCDVELSEMSLGVLDKISNLLRIHASEEGHLWVSATEVPDPDTSSSGGVPAEKLAEVWRSTAPDIAAAFELFARDLTAKSGDWVRMTGRQVIEESGSVSSDFGSIDEVLDLATRLSPPDISHHQKGATLMVRGAQGARYHAVAQYKDTSLVAEVTGAVAAELPALWRAAGH